ncbi:MAG: LysR family transcriptional regulator [Sneathiella sp.]|nr:LysR family transcriptional regulator [Sneathiella sp.]
MFDWDNIRIFLHVARSGSIRGAASVLGVNHATVLRRIAGMEEQLGARLFERFPTGYQITSTGEEILVLAEEMEANAIAVERQVFGRDTALTGSLRVTLPQLLATHLLMPDFAEFSKLYPGIDLEIIASTDPFNLTKRQADIALRVAYTTPPENLVGRKLSSIVRTVYASKKYEKDQQLNHLPWIIKEEDGSPPTWALSEQDRKNQKTMIINDPFTQVAATRAGLGRCAHFCFMGDPDPELYRVTPDTIHHYGDLWILTHGDLRRVPRVNAFMKFMTDAVLKNQRALEGRIE